MMKAHELDTAFEAGEDISGLVDWSRATRPNLAVKRVNVDFPKWGSSMAWTAKRNN